MLCFCLLLSIRGNRCHRDRDRDSGGILLFVLLSVVISIFCACDFLVGIMVGSVLSASFVDRLVMPPAFAQSLLSWSVAWWEVSDWLCLLHSRQSLTVDWLCLLADY